MKKTLLSTALALFATTALWAQESESTLSCLLEEDFSSITAGNDSTTSGSSTKWDGNDNFTAVTGAYQAGGAVKLGASKSAGSLTSKAIESFAGGDLTVEVDVKGWSSVEGQLVISATGAADTNVVYSATITDAYEHVSVTLKDVSAAPTVTIATSAKRAFVDNVKVWGIVNGGTTGGDSDTTAIGGDTIEVIIAAPTITPETGEYTEAQTVTITVAEGLTAYYTTDGTTPTVESTKYEAPFAVDTTTTITAITADANGNTSEAVAVTITIKAEEPVEPVNPDDYLLYEDFDDLTSGDNADSQASCPAWSGNLNFPTTSTAYQAGGAVKLGKSGGAGSLTSREIDFNGGTLTVEIDVKGWTKIEGTLLVSATGSDTASIAYTAIMTGAFETVVATLENVSAQPTLTIATSAKRAFIDCVKVTGISDSTGVTVEAPTLTPESGEYTEAQTVTITVAEGLTAYYTTDGTTPTAESTKYEAPFTVDSTCIVKAIAVDAAGNTSKVVSTTITILPVYTSIADMKVAATATKETVIFRFTDLLVTGVVSTSMYVTDGTDGFLFYGTTPTVAVGDKISGDVKGQLCLYSGLTEMANPSFTDVTVTSSGNAVVATDITIGKVKSDSKKYESVLIRLMNVQFAASTLDNHNVAIFDDEGEDITLRDNFKILADVTFDTIRYYNIVAVVAPYNGVPQVYPLSVDGLELITTLSTPEQGWEKDTIIATPNLDVVFENKYITNSDGAVTYTSSNPAVADIDAEGNITLGGGIGKTIITASTPETEQYLAASDDFILLVYSGGDGTLANPYHVIDAQELMDQIANKVWVKGVIVGYVNGYSLSDTSCKFAIPDSAFSNTNILLAESADVTDYEQCIPVQLPSAIRDAFNLYDHPEIFGQPVWLYGTMEKYFSVAGLKNTSDYSFDGMITAIETVRAEATAAPKAIYNILGQRVTDMSKSGIYIVDGKKVLVK